MMSTREPAQQGGRDHRNPWPASIGTGGRLRAESPADFVGMRTCGVNFPRLIPPRLLVVAAFEAQRRKMSLHHFVDGAAAGGPDLRNPITEQALENQLRGCVGSEAQFSKNILGSSRPHTLLTEISVE